MRIRVSLQLDNPEVEVEGVVFVPEVMHDFIGDLDAIPPVRAHRRIIDLDLGLGRMVQRHFLLIPARFLRRPEVLSHYPHRTALLVSLDAPEDFLLDLRPPEGVREPLSRPVELLAEPRAVRVVVWRFQRIVVHTHDVHFEHRFATNASRRCCV